MGSVGVETNGMDAREPVVDISVAIAPNDAAAAPGIQKEIAAFPDDVSQDDEARLALLEKARDLVRALETPRETMIKHLWAQTGCIPAITACQRLGVFHELAAEGGTPKFAPAIAKKVKCDPNLLSRLMRHIAAMGYIKETAQDTYKGTNFSSSLTIPVIYGGYNCLPGAMLEACNKFHEYGEEKNWIEPNTIDDGPLQYAYHTKLNLFEHLHATGYGKDFGLHMGGYRQGRPSWMDPGFFPVQERLVEGFDSSSSSDPVMLVDIGGSHGHDVDEFRRKWPEVPGRLIVQDLPPVIGAIDELDAKIERMEYDFHTEQPVKGARTYYMHSVLHDWPNETCLSILSRIKEAMKPGYSRLLINENVIPSTGAYWETTALDMMMIVLLSSRERTKDQWSSLIEDEAGLKITKIWCPRNGVESIIEVEKVE
ncbi:hypothetical protein MKZ38_000072 [Zalerion maritima]|uniref:O-methyltransferase C-terminal domain-containing protein n=1 Tax=Zalerion maritima TaxID=339359 RepID=A0AAD5RRY4_9PEZI|nr:hypothetical protein MKZ38_000072 [Zalerion maritima]